MDSKNCFSDLWQLIGNTPMVELHYRYKGKPSKIYAKVEYYNYSGSIKDRMALYILQKAYQTGQIKPTDTIVEATSGNTGISFAAVGRALGHKVKIIMPEWLSKERKDILRSLGAELVLVSKGDGGFLGGMHICEELAKQDGIFLPCQFENENNINEHAHTTAREIEFQLASIGLKPDGVVSGVGTGGTIMGVGRYIKSVYPNAQICPIEPAESPILSKGFKCGSHRIQGFTDEFVPSIVQLDKLNEIIQVSDGDSIIAAQKMAKQLGLAVGISSGCNVVGAIKLKEKLGDNAVVTTFLPDDNKKYLSTDLVCEEPMKDEYVSKDLVFEGFHTIKRLSESIIPQ